MTLTAWALTTGEAGMRTQARGLAQAVADVVIEKTTTPPPFWGWGGQSMAGDELSPPWPDILVTCGRRSVRRAIAIRKASGGRTLTVHIQDPRGRAGAFDLVIAMGHDRILAGGNVIKVPTALHDLTPENLSVAADRWRERFAGLGRPLVGVVVGGDLRGRPFTLADAGRLVERLRDLRSATGAGLAITPSRRTPAPVRALLADVFGADPRVFLWDLAGENPYRGILALADRLVVTSDSVSMVSEALSAPRPVEIFDLGFGRHAGFIQGLIDARLARRFEGDPRIPVTRGPVNSTTRAADAVMSLLRARAGLQARTGVSG
jgi:mitochondrial fission protein ELM1